MLPLVVHQNSFCEPAAQPRPAEGAQRPRWAAAAPRAEAHLLKGAHWPWRDFRESFSESCGDLAKGRKSTKVAGGARASGYNIVYGRAKFYVSRRSKKSISLENRALHAPGNRTHTDKNQDFV